MDFVRLGAAYSSTYIPDLLIEGYNSLIWTERFQEMGDFELKSFDVIGILAQLPEDTLVSHLETKEVMQVETHSIEWVGEGADARPEITVKGRSAVNVLEHRWVESSYQVKRRLRKKYSATSALCVLLYNAIDNASGFDVTRGDTDPDTEGVVNSYVWNTKDVIPNIHVTEAVPVEGVARWFQLEQGMLLPQFQKIMVDGDLGIRTIRPVSPNPGTVITVNSALATRGTIVRTYNADLPGLRFEIYKATDRTATVQFSQLQGHIDKPSYLRSTAGYKTEVEMISGVVEVTDVYRSTAESNYTGWKRKTMGFDAGSPEIPAAPEIPDRLGRNPTAAQRNNYHDAMDAYYTKRTKWRNKRNAIIADFKEAQTAAALVQLKRARKINMVAGDASDLSPYKYKLHYDLGDLVTLVGDYAKTTVEVSEYVRTEDANGDRGFPGLVVPDAPE